MSLNDPQWGRRGGGGGGGNQGPPDLDELWRNFNQRLANIFGRRRGGAPGGEPPSFRQFGGGVTLLVILVLIVWLASGFYIVDASQRGVVLTFGKYALTTQPGLRWRMPYPIQSHEVVNISQVRTIEVGYRNNVKSKVLRESLMLTDDENIVDIQFAVQYTLKDPEDYVFNVRRPDETVLQVAETAFREIVGNSSMDFALYEGREDIAARAAKLMQEVQAAFDDAVKAKQDQERAKNEGQAYYNDVVPKARGTASRLIEEANGYRQRVVAYSEGEAARFKQVLTEYNRAPAVTRERLYLETLQQIMTSTSKVMIDARAGGNLLFLPLDKIMQMSGTGTAEAVPPKPVPDAPSAPEAASRSREALRSRDREARP
jgi:membrane protease subunit HflK